MAMAMTLTLVRAPAVPRAKGLKTPQGCQRLRNPNFEANTRVVTLVGLSPSTRGLPENHEPEGAGCCRSLSSDAVTASFK